MDCVHVWEPYPAGWFMDHHGDLQREYVCRLCGAFELFTQGEYPNAHFWPED